MIVNAPSIVLIVDDVKTGQKLLGHLLAPDGYQIEYASSGKEALELAAQIEPDVILLDVMMPEMDGFQVCQRIRATPALAEIPVLMVTGLEEQEARLMGLEVGADDFISKPFNGAELRARVRTITRLNRHRRLMAERAKFEWAIAQARDGYIILDDQDRINYANAQARQYLHLMPEESDMPFIDTLIKWYQCEPTYAWIDWNTPDQPTVRYLIQPETNQSKAFWLRVDILTLPLQNDSQRLICLRDVSEEFSPSHFQSSYGEALVHKLHTPLQIALGSLELATAQSRNSTSRTLYDLIEAAYGGVKTIYQQIESLLRYLATPSFASFDNAFPMTQLPSLAEQFAQQLGITTIQIAVSSETWKESLVLSQPAMEMILWQVMENSKKFHPTNTPCIQVTAHGENNRIVMRIIDDGVTLTPAQLTHVWTPYYQAEKNFTGHIAGMGLGLSIVASHVWTVGGSCVMHNRHDRAGVIVEFRLPLKSNSAVIEPR